MICSKCGAQLPDNAQFCDKCGASTIVANAPQQPQYQAPQQPQYQQPQYQAPMQPQYQQPQYQAPMQPQYQQAPQQQMDFASLKKYTPFIAVGMAVIALIFGILVLFNCFDVTVSSLGYTSPAYDVSLLLEDSDTAMIQVGNILFGLILIVIAAVGGLFFAKNFGVKIYDSLTSVPFIKKDSPLFAMGALGAIGALFHFICFLCSGPTGISVNTPWFTWVILVVFAGIAAVDKFVFEKK